MKKILFIFCCFSLIGTYSCKTDKKETKVATKKERVIAKKTDTQLKADLLKLQQEMDAAWIEMIASDDQKIDNLQTLLARVGREKSYDKKTLSGLLSAQNNLKKQRYSQEGISSVAAVDTYDSVQVKLMDDTNNLISTSNLAERDTVAARLATKIQEDDSRVPILRGHYDKAAKTYNQYLKDYQPQIRKLGPPYTEMKPMPLFVEQQLQ
jgi:hypothetical protein